MKQANHANRRGADRGNIMIVDDTPANLHLLTRMLAEQGYQVRPVPDGLLALSAVEVQLPDLILLDIRMPEMNGYEVCKRLKAEERTRHIPVLFISALDSLDDKINAFAAGGVDYITKPFQVEEVLARVETHLTLAHLRDQLQRANNKMTKELELAGNVQRSFLPGELPEMEGWQMAVKLKPAQETSGDFFDVHLLPNHHLGILMADVLDKGVGAALFMALSWAIFRTYAEQYPSRPEQVLAAVNRRIIQDTQAEQFVTAFYGILDPLTGKILFSNAGHPPPVVLRERNGKTVQGLGLEKTGVPLGLFEDAAWEQGAIDLEPGDGLVIYTDGVIEAQNPAGVLFAEKGLLRSVRKARLSSPEEMLEAILRDVHRFMGDVPQADDIALIAVRRG
jgi:phosphoserine phosphatase RsbU/P